MGIWAMDLYDRDEVARRQRFPLLCALADAVGSLPGIKEYEAARGSRRDIYARIEAMQAKRLQGKRAKL